MLGFHRLWGIPGFGLLLYTAVRNFSMARPLGDRTPHVDDIIYKLIPRNGNPNAAGDLYGLGLRVGAYLQILGMLLSCVGSAKRSRTGILLLSSSVCLSLFTAWSILVGRRAISPCEAWLILSLSAAYGAPRFSALNEKEDPKGGIATACCLVSVVWQQILYFWFFATLYRQLPLLGTMNQAWFFAPVALDGGFRIFMLVVTCVDFIFVSCAIGPYLNMTFERFVDWSGANDLSGQDLSTENLWVRSIAATGKRVSRLRKNNYFKTISNFGDDIISKIRGRKTVEEIEEHERPAEYAETKKLIRVLRVVMSFWGFVVLALTIAGVEKIIEYNSLSPPTDLAQPGQIIPFTLGIITFLVGVSQVLKPVVKNSNRPSAETMPTGFGGVYHTNNFENFMRAQDEMSVINMSTEGETRQTADLERTPSKID